MNWPVVVRLKPLYGSATRWHLAGFLGILGKGAWLGPACGRFTGWNNHPGWLSRPVQVTYGPPTCKWCLKEQAA